MNHLAHFHLAGDCAGQIAGALLADYLRGPVDPALPARVATGVRLHRHIDAFTDAHPRVRELRGIFPGRERRLAGIALDLFFDVALAREWGRFSSVTLPEFSASVYGALRAHSECMSGPAREHARHMEHHGVLCRYLKPATAQGALERIGTRLGLETSARSAALTALGRLPDIERGFLDFYPDVLAACRRFSAG